MRLKDGVNSEDSVSDGALSYTTAQRERESGRRLVSCSNVEILSEQFKKQKRKKCDIMPQDMLLLNPGLG